MIRKGEVGRERKQASGIAWIAVSLGFLVAGVLAGASMAGSAGVWALPVAGFVGYILAFRRGMLSWNADRVWRVPARAREKPEDEIPEQSLRAESTLRRPFMGVVR
jgi:hypothetical protein